MRCPGSCTGIPGQTCYSTALVGSDMILLTQPDTLLKAEFRVLKILALPVVAFALSSLPAQPCHIVVSKKTTVHEALVGKVHDG